MDTETSAPPSDKQKSKDPPLTSPPFRGREERGLNVKSAKIVRNVEAVSNPPQFIREVFSHADH
jgi:hypothetical protein